MSKKDENLAIIEEAFKSVKPEEKAGTIEVAVILDTASPKTVEEVRRFLEGNTAWGHVPKRSSTSAKEQCTVLVYEVHVS